MCTPCISLTNIFTQCDVTRNVDALQSENTITWSLLRLLSSNVWSSHHPTTALTFAASQPRPWPVRSCSARLCSSLWRRAFHGTARTSASSYRFNRLSRRGRLLLYTFRGGRSERAAPPWLSPPPRRRHPPWRSAASSARLFSSFF